MIAIFANDPTNRLEYLLHYAISERWGHPYKLCFTEESLMEEQAEAKINYSKQPMEGAFWISPDGLLSETGIRPMKPQMTWRNGPPYSFINKADGTDLDWDPFAACFYFLSRYEELQQHMTDEHGRFRAEECVAVQNGCLQQAVVDHWLEDLAEALHRKFPAFMPVTSKVRFQPTYDIDQAYAYREKGFLINAAGFAKQLLHGNLKGIGNRAKVLAGRESDPYDTFALLRQLHEDEGLHPLHFVLFAPRSTHDKGISPENSTFRELVRHLKDDGKVGLHASYGSFRNQEALRNEKAALSECLGDKVTENRFHYLRLSLPESYRNLVATGITDDYSMGYASSAGFRAGTCHPFQYFDLQQEKELPLTIHPLLFMENCFFNSEERTEAALWRQVKPLLDEAIRYGGEIVTLFHNHSFGPMPGHDLPIPELYLKIIHYIKEQCR